MAKSNTYQRFIIRVHSKRLRAAKWDLKLTLKEARANDEIISLADSSALRMIDDIVEKKDVSDKIKLIRREIDKIRNKPNSLENKRAIRQKYEELDELQYMPHYINVIIDRQSDYKKMYKKGFRLNGKLYKRLLGTTGGVKNSTIVFVSEDVHEELWNRIDNGRDLSKDIVPAKLEAYKALTCSSSVPVSNPKGILVVDDCELHFKEDVILLDDSGDGERPKMTIQKDYDVSVVDNDGYGIIMPHAMKRWAEELGEDYLPSGMCIRNSWLKGMVFPVDFQDFNMKVVKGDGMVTDVWNNTYHINDIELILTTSMLKLWSSYDSIEHYLKCCEENGYGFSVTKVCPKTLENERFTNYQFIQTYELDDNEIDELVKPTVDKYKDILGMDYAKSLLFLRGLNMKKGEFSSIDEDFIKALSIDKRLINDPFVRSKIHKMLKKQINKAKTGVLRVRGNYQIVSGDVYMFMEHVFGLEPKGLLKSGCNYSKYWNDLGVDKVACFRAPMTSHNNIRVLDLKNTEEMQYWYQYMETVTLFGGWDTATHALNGMDKDADGIMSTDNEILINKHRKELPIVCLQKSATKIVPTEDDLYNANINGFGDDIGSTTNYITSMIDLLASFEKGSNEYNELSYRIICGQQFQQNAIDKTKGIICKPMPKTWYDYHSCKVYRENVIDKDTGEVKVKKDTEEQIREKEFLQRILVDKKPYFMCYIYPQEMRKYKDYVASTNVKSLKKFRLSLDELINKSNKTDDEKLFLEKFDRKIPVSMSNGLVNKIAWKVEKEFDGILSKLKEECEFDYSILKTPNVTYAQSTYNAIRRIYMNYKTTLTDYMQQAKTERVSKDESMVKRIMLKNNFKTQAYSICSNKYELCNVIVDLCYSKNSNKQFVWDVVGDVIVENLLKLNNFKYNNVVEDEDGTVEYSYNNFSLIANEWEVEDDCIE